MTQLSTAMKAVDEDAAADASETTIMPPTAAFEQIRRRVAGPIRPEIAPDRPPSAAIEAEINRSMAFHEAHVSVAHSIVRAGRDPAQPSAEDSGALWDMYSILIGVHGARA